MPRLVVGKGKDKGKVIDLPNSGEVVVGRELSNQFPIRDVQASRRHFKIVLEDNEIIVENLKSVNGTWVNEVKTDRAHVVVGDKIRAGETILFLVGDNKDEDHGDLTGQELAGYKIGNLLGRGGMGSVYGAQQLSLDRMVAFKVLAKELAQDQEFVSRFLEEARSAGRLNHQNIVQVYDVGQVGGTYFYSLELMDNGSVEDLLRVQGKLTIEATLPIAIDAARGLQYAEKKGLIHRDIKPANLFLSKEDVTKIGDLGIAQRFDGSGSTASQETVSGSPHYIAPEQALGKDIDQRVDLYALGVSMYEMLCGEVPYNGRSPQEIILKHINEPIPDLKLKRPGIPESLLQIVYGLMEKTPEKRISTPSQLISLLVPLLKDYPSRTTALIRLQADLSASSGRLAMSSGDEIDSIAPTDPGVESAEATASANGGADPGPSYWPRVLIGIAGLLALCCLCLVTVGQIAKSKEQESKREAKLVSLQRALSDGNYQFVRTEAKNLIASWQDKGLEDLIERADRLVNEAEVEIDDRKRAAREKQSAEVYARIEVQMRTLSTRSKDEESLRDLNKILTSFVDKYFDTQAAKRAQRDLIKVEQTIVEFKEYQRAQAVILADFQEKCKTFNSRMRRKIEGRQFGVALKMLLKFRDKNIEPKFVAAANGFEQVILSAADDSMASIRSEVSAAAANGLYLQARRIVNSNKLKVDMERYDGQFGKLLRSIDETERAAKLAIEDDLRKSDRKIVRQAFENSVKEAVNRRQFGSAARAIQNILIDIKMAKIRQEISRKAALYTLAQKAIGSLVDHVNSNKRKSKITKRIPEAGNKECVAVEADVVKLLFEAKKGIGYPYRFEVLESTEILAFFNAMKLTPQTRLYLACLAWALGQTELAKKHSKSLSKFSDRSMEKARLVLQDVLG
jgi:serine/threonine protein kinase